MFNFMIQDFPTTVIKCPRNITGVERRPFNALVEIEHFRFAVGLDDDVGHAQQLPRWHIRPEGEAKFRYNPSNLIRSRHVSLP